MMANKPETALYRAPTFSLLLASHGGISSCITTNTQAIPLRRGDPQLTGEGKPQFPWATGTGVDQNDCV